VALRGLRASYPDSTSDVIARQEALTATNDVPGCKVIHVTGTAQGRMGLVRRLRQSGYGAVAFVEAGDDGYGALQVLPLVLGIRTVVLVDEYDSVMRGWITGSPVTWCATKSGAPATPGNPGVCGKSVRHASHAWHCTGQLSVTRSSRSGGAMARRVTVHGGRLGTRTW